MQATRLGKLATYTKKILMLDRLPHDNTPLKRNRSSKFRLWALPRGSSIMVVLIAWLIVVIGGTGVLWRYEHAVGLVEPTPVRWPADSAIPASETQSTLLMFAHPKCPCTRASIGELARILTTCSDEVRAYAVFVKPSGASPEQDWDSTDLWELAKQIPGLTAIADIEGIEARRFQAATSGFTVLYDHSGQLQFSGGITASRGHSGDNQGRSAIVALLTQRPPATVNTNVYGCELGTNFSEQDQSCCPQ